jgi:hypothetical protein
MALYPGQTSSLQLTCGEDHDCKHLPDTSDPLVMKHFRCGACQLVTTQLSFKIMRQEGTNGRRLGESEAATLLEQFCDVDIEEYGLQLDERGAPLPRFTANASENRATGGWVKRALVAACQEVLSQGS